MAKYNKVLYDYIGREYERKNLYLKEVALLQNKIKHASPKEKETLKNQLKELISKESSHPYLLKLKEYEDKEKRFLDELKAKSSENKEALDKSLSKDVIELENALFESRLKEVFYKDYVDLTYDAEFHYKEAAIEIKLLPEVIEKTMRLEEDLRKALSLKPQGDKEAISKEITRFKAEKKAIYDMRSKELKGKRKDGLISEKALKNGIKEIKKNYQYAVRVKEYDDPDKMKKELIKSKKFELKDYVKVHKRVVNADIADARRNTPVEVMKTKPVNTAIGALLPGVGQLLNKQPVKAALFFVGLIFIYVVAIPYALGYANYQGEGIAGLISLAEGGRRIDKSLIFMIEGIVAIVLLLFHLHTPQHCS